MNREKVNILHREEGIFEIKPKPLRLVFFYDKNIKYPVTNTDSLTAEKAAMLVLYFEKHRDKAKPQDIDRALTLKKEYFEAKSHDGLTLHVAEV
ncbi:MAG: hypothetical protein LBS35_14315 [Synergistaceae bacterium]|nr:hypothetical protein [Synergistaceae bacterium]